MCIFDFFKDLENKAPIDPKGTFDFPTKTLLTSPEDLTQFQLDLEEKIFFNDAMEIDRNDITLHEILGEGAFGLVRRGIYNDGKSGVREVAVKMLKGMTLGISTAIVLFTYKVHVIMCTYSHFINILPKYILMHNYVHTSINYINFCY